MKKGIFSTEIRLVGSVASHCEIHPFPTWHWTITHLLYPIIMKLYFRHSSMIAVPQAEFQSD